VRLQVQANGLRFHVNRYRTGPPGDRPVVVCIHGFGVVAGASGSFMVGFDLAPHADVITYDLRGHGRSEPAPAGYRIIDHAADLVALLDALEVRVPVHLVAFSYGGTIATAATILYRDRVASLSLLDGIVPLPGWEKSFFETVERDERVIEEFKARGMSLEEIAEEIIRWVIEETGVSRRRAANTAERIIRMFENTTLREDISNEVVFAEHDISRIQCPVLGVYGDKSELYHLIDLLPRLVKDVRVHTLPGADHLDVYWRINEIRPLVREFLGLPLRT
jgi:pimeloyl-ACP methyl ester carboxylesterase